MHQVAHQHRSGFSREMRTPVAIRIALVGASALDAELTAAALNQCSAIEVVAASSDLDFCLARCQRVWPELLILDPNLGTEVVQRALEQVNAGAAQHVLVLDDQVRRGRLIQLLPHANVSYLSRQSGLEALTSGIKQIHHTGKRVFDPALRACLKKEPTGYVLDGTSHDCELDQLTARELQVLILLAEGRSVKNCAQHLELAESTIDNHKSRMMKKLDIHKIVELSHLAIREGLVVVR